MSDKLSIERLEKIAFGSVRQSQEEGVFIARELLVSRSVEKERCNQGEPWCPDVCPITGRKFFMWISHPTKGMVPTYGGPYDSYTLAEKDSDQEYVSERYDHDNGYWSDFECAGVNVVEDWLPRSQEELDEYVADNASPVLSQPVPADYFASLINQARTSADKAMRKFPQPNYVLLKVAEEAGEVVQAGVHYAEGRMTWGELEGEIIQLLAMLIRLVREGDQVNDIIPPDEVRAFELPASPVLSQTTALNDVIAERQRQITAEGYTSKHDDKHTAGELACAGASYALSGCGWSTLMYSQTWPWEPSWWKPTTPRGDLIKAAALILAEIERLDRTTIAKSTELQGDSHDAE